MKRITIDNKEVMIGHRHGIIVRYRGRIRGIILYFFDFEISWTNFNDLAYLSWKNSVRFGKKSWRF